MNGRAKDSASGTDLLKYQPTTGGYSIGQIIEGWILFAEIGELIGSPFSG
jgi:hypothetical protein